MSSPRPTLEGTVAPEEPRSRSPSSGRTRCRGDLHATRDRQRASPHSAHSASPRTLRKCKPPELHLGETALSALTPTVHLRPVAGARRAIPRTIHGVRLAITSTARSERRIAVRRPGVGIDASSASGDPARGPWRSTASNSESNTRRQRIDPRLAAAGWSARPFDHAYLVRAGPHQAVEAPARGRRQLWAKLAASGWNSSPMTSRIVWSTSPIGMCSCSSCRSLPLAW